MDASQSRAWSTTFSLAAVNAALVSGPAPAAAAAHAALWIHTKAFLLLLLLLQAQADEELSGAELSQVLATVLPCAQAVMAVLQPGSAAGQLRLEAWCHRTQRVPLLPPTPQQQQPDSDYRQAAFCIRRAGQAGRGSSVLRRPCNAFGPAVWVTGVMPQDLLACGACCRAVHRADSALLCCQGGACLRPLNRTGRAAGLA